MVSLFKLENLIESIKENDAEQAEIMLNSQPMDAGEICIDVGNALNIAIECAPVKVLAAMLGVKYPLSEGVVPIPYERYALLHKPCVGDGLTPLMKAAKCGKCESVELLLACGSEVNQVTAKGISAMCLSQDPDIVLALFEHDSRFPQLRNKREKDDFELLISKNKKLKDMFHSRDKVHLSIKQKDLSPDVKRLFEAKKWVYYVNSLGHSVLYTAGVNMNFDALVHLLDCGLWYASIAEKDEWRKYKEGMCERALSKLYHPIKGCHVMKLASKSLSFGRVPINEDLRRRVLSFIEHLDRNEVTSTLLQVLQDVPGLQIAFDFDRASIERMGMDWRDSVHGVTEFKRIRICVGAKECEEFGFRDIVSNLAHELAHMAMWVVFQNGGLPYFKTDGEREREYNGIKEKILSPPVIRICDDIIQKVTKYYDECLRGYELIVRVPEMIAKYLENETDGVDRLTNEVPELWIYYKVRIQPQFQSYIEGIETSNRISRIGFKAYQKFLMVSQEEGIQVVDDMNWDIGNFKGKHNSVLVYKTSNVKLAESHLKLSIKRTGEPDPFFVNWSFYKTNKEFFQQGLRSREIETLVISWDDDAPPQFCKRDYCMKINCPGYDFCEFDECVIFLLDSKWQTLNDIKPVEYIWDSLSEKTKQALLGRNVNFCGVSIMLKPLIWQGEGSENFLRNNLDSSDISLLLKEGDITLGKHNPWMSGQRDKLIWSQPGCFISRKVNQSYVDFNEQTLRKHKNDVFFVSNVSIEDLCQTGISRDNIRHWDPEQCDVSSRCYVVEPKVDSTDEDEIFKEILEHLHRYQCAQLLHHLKLRQGKVIHVSSANCGGMDDASVNARKDLVSLHPIDNPLKTPTFRGTDVVLIADDPGTGKTIYMNFLAKKFQRWYPRKWVSIIDLSLEEYQNHLFQWSKCSASGLEVKKLELKHWLFEMVKNGNTGLEQKLFDDYCERENDIMILFDGFDEICPKYRTAITSFIVELRKHYSNVKIFVSTRLHEKSDLENSLNALSLQLAPFSQEDQINFLDMYWNALLGTLPLVDRMERREAISDNIRKLAPEVNDQDLSNLIKDMDAVSNDAKSKERGKLKKVDFTPLARVILERYTSFQGVVRITETPLHVQMVADITFDDSFNMKKTINLAHFYQRFYDIKMKIFGREKAHSSGNVNADKLVKMSQEKMSTVLEGYSAKQLLDYDSNDMDRDEIGDAQSTGLMTLRDGADQFVHRTFAEFFVAKWLIRKASIERVKEMWVKHVLVEAGFLRVREFLEDMLFLLEGDSDKKVSGNDNELEKSEDILMLKKSNLVSSAISFSVFMWEMKVPIYELIRNGHANLLQYLADSFGENVGKVLIDMNCKKWQIPSDALLAEELRDQDRFRYDQKHERREFGNSFTYLADEMILFGKTPTPRYQRGLRKMLELMEKFKMLQEMERLLQTRGYDWLFPFNFYYSDWVVEDYYIEVLKFLIKHRYIFTGVMRAILQSLGMKSIFRLIAKKDPYLLISIIDAFMDESSLLDLFSLDGIVLSIWTDVINIIDLEKLRILWEFINNRVKDKELKLNFLIHEDEDENEWCALVNSAESERLGVMKFMWNVAGDLMEPEERTKWLLDSFSQCHSDNFGFLFHEFVVNLAKGGTITEIDLLKILVFGGSNGECYLHRYYPIGLFNAVISFEHLLDEENLRKLLTAKHCLYSNDYSYLKAPSDECKHLWEVVERTFEEVKSQDMHRLTDPLNVAEVGHLEDDYWMWNTVDMFKYQIAAIQKQVELDLHQLGARGLVHRLEHQIDNIEIPNFLNAERCYGSSYTAGYVLSILVRFLPKEELLRLLFMPDKDGNTVFHSAIRKRSTDVWGKYYTVVRVLLGEDTLYKVHSIANGEGKCVQDLFSKEM